MKKLQVETRKDNGDLSFHFLEKGMERRQIVVENIAQHQVEEGQKWWATIIKSEGQKGAVTILLHSRIDAPKLELVENLDGFWVESKKLRHIQILLRNGKDVLLEGHKGAGKTDFAIKLAKAWGSPFCKVDCGLLQSTNSLFGSEAAGDGKTIWRPSNFWLFVQQAIQAPEVIHLLLLDELNRMHAKMAEGLHGLYDHTRQVSFTTTEGTKVMKLPHNICTIGTRNKGHQYTGTYSMDAALIDRFVPIHLGYMPLGVEQDILVERHGIHSVQAEQIVQIATSLREAEQAGLLTISPSPRLTDTAALLVRYGETVADAVETAFLGGFERKDFGTSGEGNGNEVEETELERAKSHIRKFLAERKKK